MATSAAPTSDADIANKKYVDDEIVSTFSGSAKAWAYVASNGTINASFNVSSVVRNSAGNYTLNWDTDFASSNYATIGTASTSAEILTVDSQAAGSIVVITADGSASPGDQRFNIAAFGDQ